MKIPFEIEKWTSPLLLRAEGLQVELSTQPDELISSESIQKNYSFGHVFSQEKVSLPPKKKKDIGSSCVDTKRLSIVTTART